MIRIPKSSIGRLALKTGSPVWLVWLENGEVSLQPNKKLFSWPNFKRGLIVVKYGEIIEMDENLRATNATEVTDVITKNLLELADQE